MKSYLKTSLLVASASLSSVSVAELTQIDDQALSSVTGRAGLTIDIDMGVEIEEFMYKDAGSLVMQGIRVGGMNHCDEGSIGASGGSYTCDADHVGTNFDGSTGIAVDTRDPSGQDSPAIQDDSGGTTGLNNARVMVDVAGDGEDFNWGWGDVTGGWNNPFNVFGVGMGYIAGDGDLIIHGTVTNPYIVPRSYSAVDFGLEMDRFALKESNYVAGDDIANYSGTSGAGYDTTIISNLRMEGYLGGFDLIIENDGNGFTNGIADSKIIINSFFEITEMEYDFDIAGIRYEKISVHNFRGFTGMFDLEQGYTMIPTSQGFAQASTHIYAVKDAVLNLMTLNSVNGPTGANTEGYVDGILLDTKFQGDMDIEHISFGDTGESIGQIFYTDMDYDTEWVISAH